MLTKEGGIDIEEVASERPEALARLHVDPLEGFQPYQARRLIYGAGIDDPDEQKQISRSSGGSTTRSSAPTRCSARSTR